jgi:hypothetical protein
MREQNRLFTIVTSILLFLFASTATASQNALNDNLIASSPTAQAERLGKAVQLFGDPCVGKTPFYMGMYTPTHAAFWSVKCTNGKSYEVELLPDGNGTIIECPLLEAIHAGHCFKKFD